MKSFFLMIMIFLLFGVNYPLYCTDHTDGGYFLKRIEYNILMRGLMKSDNLYNVNNKSIIDRVFFGETNSPVEFVIQTSFEGAFGLRLIKDSSDSVCLIEVMSMPNSDEIVRILSKKENEILLPYELQSSISLEVMNRINEYNKKVICDKQCGEIYKPYRTKTKMIAVSQLLVDKLYYKTVSLIESFKAEGIPPLISDGDEVTFRCVVGSELWTLIIHDPQKRALQLSDIYRRIILDIRNDELNELVYLNLLDEITL